MPGYRHAGDLPQVIPVFPLDGALLLPHTELPLQIFEPRYLNMIDDVMGGERLIGMVQTQAGGDRVRPRLAHVGCVGRITSYAETPDGRYLIKLTGICRFEVGEELPALTPYRQVRALYAAFASDMADAALAPGADRRKFARVLKRYLNHRDLDIDWETANAAPLEALVNSLAMGLPFTPPEKQALLEARSFGQRFEVLTTLLEIDAEEDGDDEPHSVQ